MEEEGVHSSDEADESELIISPQIDCVLAQLNADTTTRIKPSRDNGGHEHRKSITVIISISVNVERAKERERATK